ncbi:MAG TPA: LuxR family transcriptional regulator, partial [Candidatus Limnocylindria bacterium]
MTEHLGRTETILLLDNFEQIVSAGPTVGSVLDSSPSTRIAVTSRVPLHISGEQEFSVPPLGTPPMSGTGSSQEIGATESVQLFVERARAVRPAFQLTEENAGVIGEICRALDGVPLAIELAASRLKMLSPQAILKRLGQRLDFLTGGAADAPARQRTLRATIEWSYGLLAAPDQAVLARCAVFTGGFGLDGAAAVSPGQDDDELLSSIGLLVDHNLVTAGIGADQEPRFGMLETIREFGQSELSPAEANAARDRHADFCIQLAEAAATQLQGFEHMSWLARLHEELDNIRAARAWLSESGDAERLSRLAAAMGTYFRYYGSLSEGRSWLVEARIHSHEVGAETRAAVLLHAGWLEAVGGDLALGIDLLRQALTTYDEVGNGVRSADTLYHLGS